MKPDEGQSEPSEPPDPLALGKAAASQLGGEWQLDLVEDVPPAEEESGDRSQEAGSESQETGGSKTAAGSSLTPVSCPLIPDLTPELPPSPEQLVEAMLFVGGHPLTAAVACSAVRGLTPERFQVAIDALNRRYREQWRPYADRSARRRLRAGRAPRVP